MAATLLNNLIGSRFAAVKISSFLLKNGRLYFRVKVNTDVDDTNNNTNHDNCDDNTTTTTAHKSDTNTTEMKYWIALILRNNFSRFCLFLAPPPFVCGCLWLYFFFNIVTIFCIVGRYNTPQSHLWPIL